MPANEAKSDSSQQGSETPGYPGKSKGQLGFGEIGVTSRAAGTTGGRCS